MNERRKGFWQNVTGGVDDGESYEDAALREATEETGLTQENIAKLSSLPLDFEFTDQWNNDVAEKIFAIECKTTWDISLDPSEHQNYRWIPETEITEKSVHYPTNYHALCWVKEHL